MTARLLAPDGTARVLESGVHHDPGTSTTTFSAFDLEGDWRFEVTAVDDQGRTSTATRLFRFDRTLTGAAVARPAAGRAAVGFTLARPASVGLRIETRTGVVVRALAPVPLPAGQQSLVWDGTLARGSQAYGGSYLAHLTVSSDVGTSELSIPFAFRRIG